MHCRDRTTGRQIGLFWQLLLGFGLLIAVGVGGTRILIGQVYQQVSRTETGILLPAIEQLWAAQLSDYYIAHGRSWAGVDQRLFDLWGLQRMLPVPLLEYRLSSPDGQVLVQAGEIEDQPPSGTSIYVDGQPVGRLLVQMGDQRIIAIRAHRVAPGRVPPHPPSVPLPFDKHLQRAYSFVFWAIGGCGMVLAIVLSRRLSLPLGRMTKAAQEIARGNLAVEVQGSSIAEVDALARAFNQMAADLTRADTLRRSMTADIAHELRTPLTIMKGKLEGFVDGVYPATSSEFEAVLEETAVLERLIDDLRVLSLAEAHQLPLYKEEVDLRELLLSVQQRFDATAATQGVVIEVEVLPEAAAVHADRYRLHQVLVNLVGNSLRYTGPGGRVRMTGHNTGGEIRIEVCDTGSGLQPDELAHVFDRFWRGDRSRSRESGGAGLGLAIVKQLVEAHGGSIQVRSTPAVETCFTVMLPTVTNTVHVAAEDQFVTRRARGK
ncbi:MAG: ATP-binding protein [Herpetosiphon sp.]